MRRASKVMILLAAAAYAAPIVVVAPLHALEVRPRQCCAACPDVDEVVPRLVEDCGGADGPCRNPRHHHHEGRSPHHPGQCQVCSSLGNLQPGLLIDDVPETSAVRADRFATSIYLVCLSTIISIPPRGPPPAHPL